VRSRGSRSRPELHQRGSKLKTGILTDRWVPRVTTPADNRNVQGRSVHPLEHENQLKLGAVENRRATTVSSVAVNQEPHHEVDRIKIPIADGVAGFLGRYVGQRPLHVQQRRRERREVGADVQAILREPRGGAADSREGPHRRRRRLAVEEGAGQLVRELVRAKAEVLVRRAQQGERGGDRRGEGQPVEVTAAAGR